MDNPFERALQGFGGEESKKEEKQVTPSPSKEKTLVSVPKYEVMSPFELTRKLFEFAEGNEMEHRGWSRYVDMNNEFTDNPYAKDLPQMFYPIVADYPGKYYVVSCEMRNGTYFREGTRGKSVRLSTVPKRAHTDGKIREIMIWEPEAGQGYGNVQIFTVKDSVMEQSFTKINTANEGDTDAPRGSAELKYEVDAVGGKKPISSRFDRLDEGIFELEGQQVPVRWLRNLEIEKQGTNQTEIFYRDEYIIGRHHENADNKDKRVRISIKAQGNIDDSKNIEVSIGSEVGSKNVVIFNDEQSGVKIVLHDNEPWTSKDEIVAVLKQDPNYNFLFSETVTKEGVLRLLKQKADLLTNDWDKKAHVFKSESLEEGTKDLNG